MTQTVRGTKKDAERVRNDLLVSVQQGRAGGSSVTFGELLDAWFESASPDWSPRTALEHRRIIDSVLKPALGDKKLTKLRAVDLDALYAGLRAGGPERRSLAPATVRKFHTVARSALQQAVKWEWIAVNPAADSSPPKVRKKEPIPPTPVQVALVLAAAEKDDPDLYVFIRLAAVLGARRGEILGICWKDFTDDYRSVEISSSVIIARGEVLVKETKTDRVRRVAIDDSTATVLSGASIPVRGTRSRVRRGDQPDVVRAQPRGRRLQAVATGQREPQLHPCPQRVGVGEHQAARPAPLRRHSTHLQRRRSEDRRQPSRPRQPRHDPVDLQPLRPRGRSRRGGLPRSAR